MGLTYANIEVENLFTHRTFKTKSLVNSDVVFLTVPEHIAVQLGFDLGEVSTREVVLADGSRKMIPIDRPATSSFC